MHNTIPVAVVGAGRFGRKHVEKYAQNPRASLVAIVDPNPELESRVRRRRRSRSDERRPACGLALPIYPELSLDAVNEVCEQIASFEGIVVR